MALARKPSSGVKGWKLEIFDPLGQELQARYTNQNPAGLAYGFVTKRYGNGTCGSMSFEGKPSEIIGGNARNIVRLEVDTGAEVIALHYGVLVSVPDARSGDRGEFESAPGKKLLETAVTTGAEHWLYPTPTDLSTPLRIMVGRRKPKALKYAETLFAPTGALLEGYNDFRGLNLADIFRDALKAAPAFGDDDWGTDPDGYVVLRPRAGKLTLSYDEVMLSSRRAQISGEETCTQAILRIANAPSEGAVVSAGYYPKVMTYTYTDPAHEVYEAPRVFELPQKRDGSPLLEVLAYIPNTGGSYNMSYVPSAPGKTAFEVLQDGDPNTYVYNSTAETHLLGVNSYDDPFLGVAVIIDAKAGAYNLLLKIHFEHFDLATTASTNIAEVSFNLNNLKGQGKVEARFIAPGPQAANRAYCDLTIGNPAPAIDDVRVYELRGLQVNVPVAEGIARSNINVPAQEITEITCARALADGEPIGGFILAEPVGTVEITGVPTSTPGKTTTITGAVAEITDTITAEGGMYSVIALNDKVRAPDVRTIQDAITRKLEGRI